MSHTCDAGMNKNITAAQLRRIAGRFHDALDIEHAHSKLKALLQQPILRALCSGHAREGPSSGEGDRCPRTPMERWPTKCPPALC